MLVQTQFQDIIFSINTNIGSKLIIFCKLYKRHLQSTVIFSLNLMSRQNSRHLTADTYPLKTGSGSGKSRHLTPTHQRQTVTIITQPTLLCSSFFLFYLKTPATKRPGSPGMSPTSCITKRGNIWSLVCTWPALTGSQSLHTSVVSKSVK